MSIPRGPWSVREAYDNGEPCGFVVHSGAIGICDVGYRDVADLIAAAPDLFEALKPFANFACDPPCGCHNCRAKAVIALATGGRE